MRRVALLLCVGAAGASVPAMAQCPDGTPPPCSRPVATAQAGANSVGVMLFNNVGRDTAFAYLSDGLASEIATSLARVPRLQVSSPGAVRGAQRGIEPDPRTVGRRLNVRYIVEGDYQRGGDRIRVSVRLVAVASGLQRWSESFTRPAADLLAVQEEIARSVATAIAGQLLPQERSVLAARPTRNADAYDRFLRGNFHLARRTPGGVSRAIDEYSAAVRLDPAFAQASARIALAYGLYLDWGWEFPGVPRDSQIERGIHAADRALALDSMLADGWLARGYLLTNRHPRIPENAMEDLRRSTILDPRNAEALHQYGAWLMVVGRLEDGAESMRRSLAVEPGRAVTWLQLGQAYDLMGRLPDAVAMYDSSLAVDPEFYASYNTRALTRLVIGDTAGARLDAVYAVRHSPPGEEHWGHGGMAAVAARAGDTVAARQSAALAVAAAGSRRDVFTAVNVALALAAAGEMDRAMDWLERVEPRGVLLWWNMQFSFFRSLQSHPRYQRLLGAIRPPGAPR